MMSEQPATDTTDTNQGTQERSVNISRQRNRNFNANVRFFKGSTPEIGATLSLPNERVSTDKGFEFFQDELETYILKELKNPTDVVTLVTDFFDPTLKFLNNMPKPAFDAAQAAADPMKKAVNDQMAKQFEQRIDALRTNIAKVYGLVWGQCTTGLQAEIKSEDDYNTNASTYNTQWLLEIVRKKSPGVATRGNKYLNMMNVLTHFFRDTFQGRNESEDTWYRRFKAECDTLELADLGYVFYNKSASGHKGANAIPSENDIAAEIEAYKAMFFLQFSNMQRYPDLMSFLRNSEMVDNDQYPKTWVGVYELLLQYRNDSNSSQKATEMVIRSEVHVYLSYKTAICQSRIEIMLLPVVMETSWTGNVISVMSMGTSHLNVHKHMSTEMCKLYQVGISLTQTHESKNSSIDPAWILLDTCSTDSVFANVSMVTNLRRCKENEILQIHTNSGVQTFHQIGDLKFLPIKVHVNGKSMANILSLKDVARLEQWTQRRSVPSQYICPLV